MRFLETGLGASLGASETGPETGPETDLEALRLNGPGSGPG